MFYRLMTRKKKKTGESFRRSKYKWDNHIYNKTLSNCRLILIIWEIWSAALSTNSLLAVTILWSQRMKRSFLDVYAPIGLRGSISVVSVCFFFLMVLHVADKEQVLDNILQVCAIKQMQRKYSIDQQCWGRERENLIKSRYVSRKGNEAKLNDFSFE